MTRVSAPCSALAALVLLACGAQKDETGAGEPLRLRNAIDKAPSAQFFEGKLPGTPPPEKSAMTPPPPPARRDAGTSPDTEAVGPAKIVTFTTPGFVFPGQANVNVGVTSSPNAHSVGLSLEGFGTGYWVVPVGALTIDGDRESKLLCDFGTQIPAGFQHLRAVALDESGNAGPQQDRRLCFIGNDIPSYFTPCDHSPPPEAVISLAWDANVDLDLQVLTPRGRLIDPKHPTSLPPDDAGLVPVESAQIDRDSNAACRLDGIKRENLVWSSKASPPHGRYGIYVNLFDACKQPAVRFTVGVYSALDNPDGGGRHLAKFFEQSGELLDFQANGGASRGLFVSEFVFK